MRRALVLALALGVAACSSPVGILIDPQDTSTCWLDSRSGLLEYDPKVGTTVNGIPLMWPRGYSATQVGTKVEVRDSKGRLRATTGQIGYFSGAWYHPVPPVRGLAKVWLTC